jgi:hypothetical protein
MLSELSTEKSLASVASLSELSTLAQELVGQASSDAQAQPDNQTDASDLSGYFKKQAKPQQQAPDPHPQEEPS